MEKSSSARKRKIALVGVSASAHGGIASVIRTYMAQGLFRRWQLRFFVTSDEVGWLEKLILLMKAFLSLAGCLMQGEVSLVHIHMSFRSSAYRKSLFVLLASIMRAPVVVQIHSGAFATFYESESSRLAQCYLRFTLRRAARILVLSESFRRWLAEILPAADIRVLPNPVMLPVLQSRQSKPGNEAPSIVYLGDLREAKGAFDLLYAAASLQQRGRRFRLTMAGKGEVDGPKALAAKLDILDNVLLPGWLESEARHELLQAADIFVLPSYFEAMPMSLLEAMSYGLPVVATPVGGIPEVVEDGAEGLLVQPGDRDALARALACLLDEPALRRQMGAAARRRCEESFSAERVMARLEEIYHEFGVRKPTRATDEGGMAQMWANKIVDRK